MQRKVLPFANVLIANEILPDLQTKKILQAVSGNRALQSRDGTGQDFLDPTGKIQNLRG